MMEIAENTKSILPKVDLPLTEVSLPSNGEKVMIRPYTVKEERIILKAVETNDFDQFILSVKQVLNNCVSGKNFNVDILPQFDIEYLFMRIYGVSKNNILTMYYKNNDCDKEDGGPCNKPLQVEIDIEDIGIEYFNEKTGQYTKYSSKEFGYTKRGKKIMFTTNIGVMMRFPRLADINLIKEQSDILFKERLVQNCIEGVFDKEQYIPRSQVTDEQIEEFFENLLVQYKEILIQFINTIPMIRKNVTVECLTCKYKQDVELLGLKDFFG